VYVLGGRLIIMRRVRLKNCPGAISLVLLFITIKAMIFGYKVDVSVLLVPVATLFAFTTLRGSLPGVPSGFGMCSIPFAANQ